MSSLTSHKNAFVKNIFELQTPLAQGLLCTLIANFIVGILNFLSQIWFARVLGIEIVGQYALIIVALDLSCLPINFGFNLSVIRHKGETKTFRGALALILIQIHFIPIICGIIYLGYYLVAPQQATVLFIPYMLMIFSKILCIFSTIIYAPLESKLHYRFLSGARLVSTIFGLGIASLFVFSKPGVYCFVARDLAIATALLCITWISVRPNLKPEFSRQALYPVWRFSLRVWGLNLLEKGALRLDYALVGLALGRDSLGIYFQIRAIMEGILAFCLKPIQTVMYAFYCNHVSPKLLFNRFVKYGNLLMLISAIFFSLLIIPFSKSLIIFILGDEWIRGFTLLPGFMFYLWAILWFENIKVMAMSKDLHHLVMWGRIFQITALIVLLIPTIKLWGFAGAGTVVGMSAGVLAGLSATMFQRRLQNVEI